MAKATTTNNPFLTPSIPAGHGTVHLTLLPPSLPTFSTLSYRYPLKLLTRTPACPLGAGKYPAHASTPVHLYILTYGGGLLPGDHIVVSIRLSARTRMVIATPQGSQKIYRTVGQRQHREDDGGDDGEGEGIGSQEDKAKEEEEQLAEEMAEKSSQSLTVHLEPFSALCYLPDPTVPYSDSQYEQVQRFYMHQPCAPFPSPDTDPAVPSLCLLDWVTQGRGACGEDWSFRSWRGKNEVYACDIPPELPDEAGPADEVKKKERLLLRDNIILEADPDPNSRKNNNDNKNEGEGESALTRPLSLRDRVHPHGIIGTLILYGPLFADLAAFFMSEFRRQPRIGGRNWGAGTASTPSAQSTTTTDPSAAAAADAAVEAKAKEEAEQAEQVRRRAKLSEKVSWTASRVRDERFVVVKFGAKDFESAREWLGEMVRREGSIGREFGEEGYGCL